MTFLPRRTGAGRSVFLLLGAVAVAGCFDPSDPSASTDTDDPTGSSSPTTMSSSPTTMMTSSPSSTSNSSEPSSSTDNPTTTTGPTSTTDETMTGPEESSSSGDVSDCPGGAPTAGEAPYVMAPVTPAQDSQAVDIADINGDDDLDLISLSRSNTSVETFFGDGAGGLVSDGVTVLGTDGFPDTVKLAAIADDTIDLFVHMEGPVELWVVRGDGAGNWPSPQVYEGTYVRAIDIADLDGDDVQDLAYVGASNLEVRLGEAAETYQPSVSYGANFGNVVRIADITGDGTLDLLTSDYGTTELQVYSGNGDGSFVAEPTVVTGSPISGIDVGHVDDGGELDLVLVTEEDLRVFYGEAGGGVSSTPGTVIDGAFGRVRVADIDASGVDDLVTFTGASIEIRFANGDATFSDATPFTCPSSLYAIEIGDLNEDCVPDIVGPQGAGQDICILLSDRS